ncbi:MAG: polyamine aminopropyltransferase [Calditrichaeota bacterium]|nr:MAG: polyamine aminopropyltransferase [Calditrichota bacterium]
MKEQALSTPAADTTQRSKTPSGNFLLKACIFATGLAGIVAEYVMATLASYLLGNAVLQWTLTVSVMLFAMGVGSRISKYIRNSLLDAFVWVELLLSLLCASSAALIYFLSIYIQWIAPLLYFLSFCIGLLIGLEIPLATRLNDFFEELRINISSVMEKDYYGALLGGLLFAFVALPYLGLTYTPIILGSINFLVAFALFLRHRKVLDSPRKVSMGFLVVPIFLILIAWNVEPIILYGEQQKYVDRIIYQEQSPYQRIVVTQWKEHFWLFLNGNEQFSSYDEERYHEPLVHPAMQLSVSRDHVLVLGGGDGLAVREILKYPDVKRVTLVDLDPAVTRLGQTHPLFVKLNENALNHPAVTIINTDAYAYLKETGNIYDVIIIDLPDPKTVDLARLYTREFYQLCSRHLSKGGTIVTQATSPFFSRKAFLSILKSFRAANLSAIPYHNNIPTLGEWGWVVGIKGVKISPEAMREKLAQLTFENIPTRFLNNDAMISMIHFGKGELDDYDEIEVNHELNLAVYHYYKSNDWELY